DLVDRREALVRPVRKRRLARQAGGVRDEVLDRDGRSVEMVGDRLEPGQDVGHAIVEAQLAGVAKLEDGRRRERLGDGGDAVERLRRRRRLALDVGPAEAPRPYELLVVDDGER